MLKKGSLKQARETINESQASLHVLIVQKDAVLNLITE